MSGLRLPVPLRSVLSSPAGQDHRSWVRPVASGPPVCPSSDFWASSQVCAPLNPAFRPSNAACCSSCATPRCHPGPCRSHHHLPSPGRPPASISTLLTRPSAARASFLPPPCALCAGLRVAPRATNAAARVAGRAAGAAGSMAAAWTAAETAVWPPGWAMAAARAPVRASPMAFGSSSRAAAAAALEAATAAEGRLWRPGRRLRGVGSPRTAGGAFEPRKALQGRAGSALGCGLVVRCFFKKKVRPLVMCFLVLSCASLCMWCACAFLTPLTLLYA